MQAVSDGGWLAEARHCPSPNFDARPDGCAVDLLVIHNISLPPAQFGGCYIEDFFCNRLDVSCHPYFEEIAGMQVSAHFLVRRSGELLQFVGLDARAWHAGLSQFEGRERCNDFSVGIELEGTDDIPYSDAQYAALVQLSRRIMAYYPGIHVGNIVGHSDIAPERKTDPGPAFDWQRYRTGLAPAPEE